MIKDSVRFTVPCGLWVVMAVFYIVALASKYVIP